MLTALYLWRLFGATIFLVVCKGLQNSQVHPLCTSKQRHHYGRTKIQMEYVVIGSNMTALYAFILGNLFANSALARAHDGYEQFTGSLSNYGAAYTAGGAMVLYLPNKTCTNVLSAICKFVYDMRLSSEKTCLWDHARNPAWNPGANDVPDLSDL